MPGPPVNPFAKAGAPTSPARTAVGPSVDAQGATKPVNPFARKDTSSAPAPLAVAPAPAATPAVIPQTPSPKRDDPSPFSPSAAISRGAPTIPDGLLPSPLVHNADGVPDDDPYDFRAAPAVTGSLDSLNPFPKEETTAASINYTIRGSQASATLGSLTAAVAATAVAEPAVPPPLPPVPPPADDMALFAPSVPPPLASAFSPSLAAVPFDSFQPSSAAELEPPPPLPTPSSPPPPVPVFSIDSSFPVSAPLPPPQDDYEDPLAIFSLPTATAVNPVDDDDLFGSDGGASSVPSFAAPPPVRRAGGDSRPGPKSILDASNADAFSSRPAPAATAVPVNSRAAGAVRTTATASSAGGARAGAGARSTGSASGRAAGPASRGGAASAQMPPRLRWPKSSRGADATARLREHYSVPAETGREREEGGDDGEYDLDLDPDRPRNIRTGRGGVASRGAGSRGRGAGSGSDSGGLSSGAAGNDVGYEDEDAELGAGGEGELEMEGDVLARTDLYSLFSKEWKPHYWVVKGSFLLLYANIHDYNYNSGTAVRKKVPITHTMRCLKIKGKSYGGHGLLWNFMVEDELDYGRANVAKFGSQNKASIEALYTTLRCLVEDKRKARDEARGVARYGQK